MQILEVQRANWAKYKNTSTGRGPQGTFVRYVEEIGELAKAIRNDDRKNMEEEFADNLAWLLTLAEMHSVNLEEAYNNKYGEAVCFRCHLKECICPEIHR
jgi:NTP pyrophosphatase (non-canonical NTP hydrolase)